MATRMYLRNTTTQPKAIPQNGYLDIQDVAGAVAAEKNTGSVSGTERQVVFSAGTNVPMAWWSERIVGTTTLSGTITFNLGGYCAVAPLQSTKLRAKLYKITTGGSDVETFIAQATASADLSTTKTIFSFTATPASVTVSPDERFILRVFLVTPTPEALDTKLLIFNAASTGYDSWVEFAETFAFRDNTTQLRLRRTSTIGIGSFLDMLEAQGGSSYDSGVVDTTAGGSEIQWMQKSALGPVAATHVSAAAISDPSDLAAYTSASFTPVANRLYLLAVLHSDVAPEATVPTIATTTGLNFVSLGGPFFDTIASNVHRLTVFRAMKPSGLSAGTYTVNLADAGTGCVAKLIEVTGVKTTGADGADAVRSSSYGSADAGANPSITIVAAFAHTADGVIGFFGSDSATPPTVGSGFTSAGHSTTTLPTKGLFCEWRADNDLSVDCTLAASDWGGMACELVAQHVPSATVLEWISPRLQFSWALDSLAYLAGTVWAYESNALANAALVVKLFRRRPDGTESLLISRAQGELPPGAAAWPVGSGGTPTLHSTEGAHEDDRLVFRCYIKNVGTMAAGYYATLNFDHNVAAVNGDSFLTLLDAPLFKAEGDPGGSVIAPNGLMTGGVGT